MRIVLTLGLMLVFSVACGYTKGKEPSLDAFVEKACANVTDENWRAINMRGQTSRDYCEYQMNFWYSSSSPAQPCNIGGMARFCTLGENGLQVFGPNQNLLFTIHPEDMERVRPHLEML